MNIMIWGPSSSRLLTWATTFGVVVQASAQLALPPLPPLPPPITATNGVRYAPIKPPQVIASQPVGIPARPATASSAILPPYLQQPAAAPVQPVLPARPTVVQPQAFTSVQPTAPTLPPTSLAWDAETKEYNAQAGEPTAKFTFWLTNVCASEVLINSVRTSCGCTVAKLPAQPWHLTSGTNGPIEVTVNLQGKSGTIVKTVTVDSNTGIKNLLVKVNIPLGAVAGQPPAGMAPMDRMRNMQLALANRQNVLKGECAKCHVQPAEGKMGKELYATACSICHNAEHKATVVPDLQNLPHPTNAEYWKQFTTAGKTNSLMPAFAKEQDGFMTQAQIESLVQYLVNDFPKEPKIVYHEPASVPQRLLTATNAPSASLIKPIDNLPTSASVITPKAGQ
jgi:mono/diheme cytochrome c family protein